MSWLAVLGFVCLGVFFLQKAVRRNAARSWAWGRVGGGPPLSRKSYAVWGAAFITIAWVLSQAPQPSFSAVVSLVLCFLAMLAVGCADSAAARTPRSGHETGE